MSLKIVHAVFIVLATLMVGLLGVWAAARYGAAGGGGLLALGAGSLAGVVVLTAYARAFVRRCRREGWS